MALLSLSAGLAAGQAKPSGVPAGAGMTGASVTSAPVKKDSEPMALAGMLASQNDSRARVGVPALVWSADLAAKAEETAKKASAGSCAQTPVIRIGRERKAAVSWFTGLRRFGGGDSVQEISPSYLVSRWREGRAEYDLSTGLCRRKTPACESYSRMVAPAAKAVGCARAVCQNQSQVWVCHYSE